jgi:tetratricopeptide (TPR) repeat protein/predicted Ser/Thr protein kinase
VAIDEDDVPEAQTSLALVGQTIHERYEVVRELGAGSLGRVYLVRDRARGGDPIALKVVRADRVSADSLSYLRTEFQNLARLRHPNVASVYDLDRLAGRPEIFFTEEYLDGKDIVSAAKGKPLEVFVDLFVQTLRALAYVHARGLLHADMKPKNIFVVAQPESGKPLVKVMDFHLARELRGPLDRSLRGTIAYMAPEVVKGERPDARADLYSLGVVAYEALAGALPFSGRSAMEVLRAHANEVVEPLRARGAKVPPALEAVVLRLLEKKPDARFKGANDVIRALNAGLGRKDAVETAETREGYILSPRFVGRERELATLMEVARTLGAREGPAPRPSPASGGGRAVEISFDGMEQEEPIASIEDTLESSDSDEGATGPLPSHRTPDPDSGSARVFLVRGEGGVGKSRLLRELRVLCQVAGLPVHEIAPGEIGSRPYGPFLDLVEAVLRREDPEHRSQVLGPDGRASMARIAALAAAGDAPPENPRAARLETTARLGTFLVARARAKPFVALVERAEALDEGSLELVRWLAAEEESADALFVLAARDEGEGSPLDGIERLPRGARLTLERLTPRGTAELLASMVAADSVPEDFARRVHEATGGNPRFVAESLRLLVEAHAVTTRDGVLAIAPDAVANLRAPRGVVEVAARRVGRLGEDERILLAALAASPRPRPLAFASQVAGLARERAEKALTELVRRGLVEGPTVDLGAEVYSLESSPVREAALESLPPGRESALHLACARLLEARHPSAIGGVARDGDASPGDGARDDAPRDRAEELLHHLARAGAPGRAFRYALEAAEGARARFEPARAARLYQRALELTESARQEEKEAPSAAEVARVRVHLGEARLALGDRRGAALLLSEAAEDGQAPPAVVALARRLEAALKKSLGAYDRSERALDRAARAASVAIADGDPDGARELARAHAERASVKLWRGDYRAALEEGKRALAALRACALEEEVAPVCQTLYHAAHFSGDDAAARAFLREGLGARPALDPRTRPDERSPGARAALAALSESEQAARPNASLGDAGGAHVPLSNVGAAFDRVGRPQDLELIYERKVDLLEATRDLEGAALAHNNLANLRRIAGRYDLAIRGYRRALSLHRALGGRPGVAVARLNLARAVAELGDPRGAQARASRARAAARSCGARWIEAQAELAIADAARRGGETAAARVALERATAILASIKNVPLLAEVDLTRAEVELDAQELGRAEEALGAFENAPGTATSALAVARARILRSRLLVARARSAPEAERPRLLEHAERAAEEALETARTLVAPELLWRAARARAAARAARGDLVTALEDVVLAMDTLRKVAQGLPRDLRALYLAEPTRLEVKEAFRALEA